MNKRIKTTFFWAKVILILLIIATGTFGAFISFGKKSGNNNMNITTAPVIRGNLVVDILETGSIEASDSLVIKSEVEGMTTIISIVQEGTIVSEEDVKNKKVLVQLDASEYKEKLTQQEITVQSAEAELTDASESYVIRINENESNEKAGELKLKFAQMDLEKYLGEKAAEAFLKDQITLDQLIEFPELGGKALQELRTLENDIKDASQELALAKDTYEWTEKLYKKDYVTRNELDRDSLDASRRIVVHEKNLTELELFQRYEFRKETEQLRSDYEEASRELERIKAKSRSELAKAVARLRSNQAQYSQRKEARDKYQKMVDNCIIEASKPGLVVYAGSGEPWRGDQIKEGAQVRERQEIIKIPNTSSMLVQARIHESVITRVKEGLPVKVTIDAIPNHEFEGKVKKVGLVPDSQNRWMNPDLKVYITDIEIQGSHPNLKPGMSAQVQVIVDELKDILMVPLQAVGRHKNDSVCYVATLTGPQLKAVQPGDFNDKFIEIKDGLKEGEEVVLNPGPLLDELRMTDKAQWSPPVKKDSPLQKEAPEKKEGSPDAVKPADQPVVQPAGQITGSTAASQSAEAAAAQTPSQKQPEEKPKEPERAEAGSA